mgnify:CR=1 FL=1
MTNAENKEISDKTLDRIFEEIVDKFLAELKEKIMNLYKELIKFKMPI